MPMSVHYGGRGPGHIARVQGGGPTRSLDFSTALPSGVTFSRGSSATYFDSAGILQTASSNVARIDYDPVTLVSRGLLIEEARTNLCLRSAEFDNASWTATGGASVTANAAVAPDGTTTAESVNNSLNSSEVNQNCTIVSGSTYTASVWVKQAPSGSATHVRLSSNNSAAWGTGGSTKVALTSSWQRVTLTGSIAATTWRVVIGARDASGAGDNDCIGNVLIWGAQLELGAFATSYIPTAGSTVARSADVVYFDYDYPDNEWTIYSEFTPAYATSSQYLDAYYTATPEQNRLNVYNTDAFYKAASANQASYGISFASGVAKKFAFATKVNDINYALSGSAGTADTSCAIENNINRTRFGGNYAGTSGAMWLKAFRLYNTRLPDAHLQALTA